MEEWANAINQNPQDEKAIIEAAKSLTDEDWSKLDQEYAAAEQSENKTISRPDKKHGIPPF